MIVAISRNVFSSQRLAGATLLVFANKQDLPGAMSAEEIRVVCIFVLMQYVYISSL